MKMVILLTLVTNLSWGAMARKYFELRDVDGPIFGPEVCEPIMRTPDYIRECKSATQLDLPGFALYGKVESVYGEEGYCWCRKYN